MPHDVHLFAIGSGVSFIALAGAFLFLRDRFLEGSLRKPPPGKED